MECVAGNKMIVTGAIYSRKILFAKYFCFFWLLNILWSDLNLRIIRLIGKSLKFLISLKWLTYYLDVAEFSGIISNKSYRFASVKINIPKLKKIVAQNLQKSLKKLKINFYKVALAVEEFR